MFKRGKLIERLVIALGLYYDNPYYGPDHVFEKYVEDVEKNAAEQAERQKIEKIMRDLLKSNVFKQV